MTIRKLIPWVDIEKYREEACDTGWKHGLSAKRGEYLDLSLGLLWGGDTTWLRARGLITWREERGADSVRESDLSWEEYVAESAIRRYVPIIGALPCEIPKKARVVRDGVECIDLAKGLLGWAATAALRREGIISEWEEDAADYVCGKSAPVSCYKEFM